MATRQIRRTGFNRGIVAQTGVLPSGVSFLQETFPLEIRDMQDKVISESADGTKQKALRITGVFQKCDALNQNGRIYPSDILGEAVEAIQEDLGRRMVIGEYDHPSDAKIHLERVSHLITKVWVEGKYVYGEAEVIEGTDCGRNLAALLRAGVRVGISSRGVGDMECVNEGREDEHYIVQPGYRFVTWDVVGEPSVEEATLSVMENKNRIITRASKKQPERQLIEELDKYFKC